MKASLALSAMLVVLAVSSSLSAEELSRAEVRNLLRRLDSAERRLEGLETRPLGAGVSAQYSSYPTWGSDDGDPNGLGIEAKTKPSLQINGRVHADYWAFGDSSPGIGFFEHSLPALANYGADPEDRLGFRRLRVEMKGDLYETMTYRLHVDFANPNFPSIKDAHVGWEDLPYVGALRIGNQKLPLGLDYLNSSKLNIFLERPLVIEAVNEDVRRLGIAAHNTTGDMTYNWSYGLFALDQVAVDGQVIGDSMQMSGNARLAASPWYDEPSGGRYYLHWAVSGMVARPDGDKTAADSNLNQSRFRTRGELRSRSRWVDTQAIAGADWFETIGVESMLNIGSLQVVGEYLSTWMQRDNVTTGTGPDLNFRGGYVHVAYMLTGEHIPLDRKSGTIGRVVPFENFFLVDTCNNGIGRGMGAWQVAARYSFVDLSDEDILGGRQSNGALALVWYFNPHSALLFNAIYGDIEDHSPVAGYTDGHYTAFGTRLRVDF